uniref:ATP synthase subunit epsilon, mitochondrial n=1 Tax=Mesocestoides corti TaxID=53468 RepID=A0A5K3FBL2_MESCO
MFYWRTAGLNYLRYSSICAKALRSALKPEVKHSINVADSQVIKTQWKEGKPIKKTQ